MHITVFYWELAENPAPIPSIDTGWGICLAWERNGSASCGLVAHHDSVDSAGRSIRRHDVKHRRRLAGGRPADLCWCPPLCYQERLSDHTNNLPCCPAVSAACIMFKLVFFFYLSHWCSDLHAFYTKWCQSFQKCVAKHLKQKCQFVVHSSFPNVKICRFCLYYYKLHITFNCSYLI